jgi:transcription elongation factor Elf1
MTEQTFACPHCNQNLSAPADMAGHDIECPTCRKHLHVPAATNFQPVDQTRAFSG